MTTIHSPAQRAGFMRVPALALAGALLVSGFALGQIAPNLVEMIGPLDSARTEAIAPALTTASRPPTTTRPGTASVRPD